MSLTSTNREYLAKAKDAFRKLAVALMKEDVVSSPASYPKSGCIAFAISQPLVDNGIGHAAIKNAFILIVGFPFAATTPFTVRRKADICSLSVS